MDWLSNNSDPLLVALAVGQISLFLSWLGSFAVTLGSCSDIIVSVLALDLLLVVLVSISYILPNPELNTRPGSNSFSSKIYKPGLLARDLFQSDFYGISKSIPLV